MWSMWWSSIASASTFMPPNGTEVSKSVDHIYAFLLISSLISFVILIGGMCYFVYAYKRKTGTDKTAYITHNHLLEFIWSFVPFCIFMFVFAWGWWVYHQMRTYPENSLEVHVFAKKWDWRFVYKSGKEITSSVDAENKKVPATLVVPLGRPVKLIMSSEKLNPNDPLDRAVLHSFFIPAFRVKQDIVPGRYTSLGFTPEKLGEFHVFCAEFCGGGHSAMRGMVKVVTPEEFDQWLSSEGSGAMSLVDKGRAIFSAKACVGCHSLDGTRLVGPTFKGLWGRGGELENGGSSKADENYIRESILEPNSKIVKGYPAGVMPTFAGQLADEDINAVIEFIKSVK